LLKIGFFLPVTGNWKEPIPGWVENLNGPTGIIVGGGKGVIRSIHCRAEFSADLMPCDIAINTIIVLAWRVATLRFVSVSLSHTISVASEILE
jgi:fatty acyl-CoA reductase